MSVLLFLLLREQGIGMGTDMGSGTSARAEADKVMSGDSNGERKIVSESELSSVAAECWARLYDSLQSAGHFDCLCIHSVHRLFPRELSMRLVRRMVLQDVPGLSLQLLHKRRVEETQDLL